jgi:type IV secretory pathway VirJ component
MERRRRTHKGTRPNRLRRGLFTALTLVGLLTVARPSNATEPPAGPAVTDLPLIEVPGNGDLGLLAVYLTGDGGYHGTDKGIAQGLASAGIPVAALNTRKYFGTARSPESAAEDLARILRHYLEAWHARQFITIGYSYGANVMPYLLTRLPQDLRTRLRAVVLVSPTEWADFHFHITEWLGVSHSTRYPVTPELERLHGTQVLCFYGASDGETIGPRLDPSLVTKTEIPGGHLVGKGTQLIVEKIVETIRDHSISAVPLTSGRRAWALCVGSIRGGDCETSAVFGADRAGAALRRVLLEWYLGRRARPQDQRPI